MPHVTHWTKQQKEP